MNKLLLSVAALLSVSAVSLNAGWIWDKEAADVAPKNGQAVTHVQTKNAAVVMARTDVKTAKALKRDAVVRLAEARRNLKKAEVEVRRASAAVKRLSSK